MKSKTDKVYKELATTEPNLNQLLEDFTWCVQRQNSTVFRRQKQNYNTRYCIWPNQSLDGKKWTTAQGPKVFPWEGASDARVPLIDNYINQDVAFLMAAWRRMRSIVSGTEINDAAFANRMTQVLRWMLYTQMTEAPRELRLTANYMLERGVAILGVFWEQRQQLGYETIDMETIKGISMQAEQQAQMTGQADNLMQMMIDLPRIIMDPSLEDEAVQVAALQYPDVQTTRLHKVIADLRTTGMAKFPRPYTVKNRPTFVALAPNEEIFIPPEATDIQTTRGLHRRELVTETTLRDRITSMHWDRDWVEEVIATQRGKVTTDFDGNISHRIQRVNSTGVLNVEKLFEVVHSFERKHDEDGVPGIYMTVWSPHMIKDAKRRENTYALRTLLDYQHGEYPFVLFERETRGRLLDDSRGYGEIAATWQQQIKTEWDSRIDLASIATLPPSYYPPGAPPDSWGPGVGIPTDRPDDYGFMEVPRSNGALSSEVQENVREFSDEYFGRSINPEKAVLMSTMRQDLADNWLAACGMANTQVMQLMQQYMPDQFYYRIVGSNKGRPIHSTRDEIQGKFDVTTAFNAKVLDPEYVKAEFELLGQVMNADTSGRIDRDEVLSVMFELTDPNLGERLLKSAEESSQSEIDDEAAAFAKMFSGQQVDIRPGQAYQLRLNWLQQQMSTNPTAQQMYQSNKQFKENVDRRLQQLNFQLQQRENAITGKFLGTKMGPQQQLQA